MKLRLRCKNATHKNDSSRWLNRKSFVTTVSWPLLFSSSSYSGIDEIADRWAAADGLIQARNAASDVFPRPPNADESKLYNTQRTVFTKQSLRSECTRTNGHHQRKNTTYTKNVSPIIGYPSNLQNVSKPMTPDSSSRFHMHLTSVLRRGPRAMTHWYMNQDLI